MAAPYCYPGALQLPVLVLMFCCGCPEILHRLKQRGLHLPCVWALCSWSVTLKHLASLESYARRGRVWSSQLQNCELR